MRLVEMMIEMRSRVFGSINDSMWWRWSCVEEVKILLLLDFWAPARKVAALVTVYEFPETEKDKIVFKSNIRSSLLLTKSYKSEINRLKLLLKYFGY